MVVLHFCKAWPAKIVNFNLLTCELQKKIFVVYCFGGKSNLAVL